MQQRRRPVRRDAGSRRRRGGAAERAVRLRVDAAGEELALDVRVPVVLDLVVRPARQPPGDQGPSAPSRDEAESMPGNGGVMRCGRGMDWMHGAN